VKNLKIKQPAFLQLALTFVFLTAATAAVFGPDIEDFFTRPKPDDSLRNVLSSPDAFEGMSITVEGYEHCQFEGNALYISKHGRSKGDRQQLLLAIDEKNNYWARFKEYNNRLVKMTGTLSHPKTGHTNYRPCWLSKITNIELIGSQ
jgi:hypothetical protein